MTTQFIVDSLSAWLRESVCGKLQFKTAAEYQFASANEDYAFRLSHPAVYPAFFPHDAAEHNEDDTQSPIVAPCIIVSADGQSTFNRADGWIETPITLSLQIWNPGTHYTENGIPSFQVGDEGWRDISVFCDTVVKAIAVAEFPGGLVLSGESISFSLPDVEKNDFYPYYRAEIDFSVSYLRRLPNKFNI